MSAECTETRFKEKIRIEFGAPVLCVELTDSQLDHLLENVKRWFIAFVGGYPKITGQTVAEGARELTLGQDVEQVVDVAFEDRYPLGQLAPELFLGGAFPIGLFAGTLGGGYVGGTYGGGASNSFNSQRGNGNVDLLPVSGLIQSFQYLEQIARVTSSDNDWSFDEHSKILQLFPKRGRSQKVIIFYLSNEFALNCLTAKECELFYQRFKAEAFQLVGMMRSKWSSFPVPGGERQLNYDMLFEQSRELMEKTEELAYEMFAPFPFSLE